MYRAEIVMMQKGISQAEVARVTGIHPSAINRVLRGRMKPFPKYRRAFVYALGWEGDPSELFEIVEGE